VWTEMSKSLHQNRAPKLEHPNSFKHHTSSNTFTVHHFQPIPNRQTVHIPERNSCPILDTRNYFNPMDFLNREQKENKRPNFGQEKILHAII